MFSGQKWLALGLYSQPFPDCALYNLLVLNSLDLKPGSGIYYKQIMYSEFPKGTQCLMPRPPAHMSGRSS
jgi:hypothetical protein